MKRGYYKYLKVLFALIIVCCMPISTKADIGNNNRYDDNSGSSSSSSGSSSSPSSGSSSSSSSGRSTGSSYGSTTSGLDGSFFAFLLVAGVVCFILFGGMSAITASGDQNESSTAGAKKKSLLDIIKDNNPEFVEEDFIALAKGIFLRSQYAWSNRDLEELSEIETEDLYKQHAVLVKDYIKNNKINVVEKILIKNCSIYSYKCANNKETIKLRITAMMKDYVIDASSKEVLESDPSKDWTLKYEMTLEREFGYDGINIDKEHETYQCPSCGGTNKVSNDMVCEYCGKDMKVNKSDWLLDDIHSA